MIAFATLFLGLVLGLGLGGDPAGVGSHMYPGPPRGAFQLSGQGNDRVQTGNRHPMIPDDPQGIPVNVRCYSGYKADERPVSFSFKDRDLAVTEILDRWYGPDYAYFKLRADDGNMYILRHSEHRDEWQLHYFEQSG